MAMPIQPQRIIYYQMSTTNKSFLRMHYFLKDKGIKNNKFMLTLIDKDLAGIDPYDPRLNQLMKQKILREVMCNYWYFLREIVRIPDQGAQGIGVKYKLHRGNLALNFLQMLNINTMLELPRQQFKTVSAVCRYLYLFNFGTSRSEITLLNKRLEDSKINLQRLKDIRNNLPSYLRMNQPFTKDGKKVKMSDTIEKLDHPLNGNRIKTTPSARNKVAAANLLRGRTIPLLWADEWAFIPFNDIIYQNTVPAFKTAAMNAKRNRAPYGMLLTTTPGFLTTDEGRIAYEMKENATPFNEDWYDRTYDQIMTIIDANNKSTFVYVKYTYQQLGLPETWFKEICKDTQLNWNTIRREILLEWSNGVENSPFTQEELEKVSLLVKTPIRSVYFLGKYLFNIYEEIPIGYDGQPKYPPIVGVDVSGGYNRDSSAIACVDSKTTRLFANLKCNYISTLDLARVIVELVTKFMNNAIVNVERNGGFGASVLAKLVTSGIKRNLYYEIKDKIIEEQNTGLKVIKKTQKTKIYGLDSTKSVRELLIGILRERMENHKDKFVSEEIYKELLGMEVKRSGKVEHSSNTHDDLVFAYLMALYVWYEGKNLKERFNLDKCTIKTDEDVDEAIDGLDEILKEDITETLIQQDNEDNPIGHMDDLAAAQKAKGMLYREWASTQMEKDKESLEKLLSNKVAREAYARQYNIPIDELNSYTGRGIPLDVFLDFYRDGTEKDEDNELTKLYKSL